MKTLFAKEWKFVGSISKWFDEMMLLSGDNILWQNSEGQLLNMQTISWRNSGDIWSQASQIFFTSIYSEEETQ